MNCTPLLYIQTGLKAMRSEALRKFSFESILYFGLCEDDVETKLRNIANLAYTSFFVVAC